MGHQVIIRRLYAYTEPQAKVLFLRRIAKEHGVPYGYVFNEFNGEKENFSIEEEVDERRTVCM